MMLCYSILRYSYYVLPPYCYSIDLLVRVQHLAGLAGLTTLGLLA